MKPITRGRIARIEPDFDVDDVESRKGQNTLNGKPSAAFNVVRTGALPGGRDYLAGEMAQRVDDRVEYPEIHDDGTIELKTKDTVEERYSAYAAVPNRVLVYWSEFATSSFYINTPAYEVDERAIDLNAFLREKQSSIFSASTVGFAGRPDAGSKGTLYGNGDVFGDDDLGDDLRRTPLNQLRVEFDSSRYGVVSAYLAASGYVEVYEGVSETDDFLQFLLDDVVPFAIDAEEEADVDGLDATTDDSAENDEQFSNLDTVNVTDGGSDE